MKFIVRFMNTPVGVGKGYNSLGEAKFSGLYSYIVRDLQLLKPIKERAREEIPPLRLLRYHPLKINTIQIIIILAGKHIKINQESWIKLIINRGVWTWIELIINKRVWL